VSLPPELRETLPPGTLARATRHEDGVLLRPIDPEVPEVPDVPEVPS
jgi:hypothetical protein